MDLNTGIASPCQGIHPPPQSGFTLVGPDSAERCSLEHRVRSGFGMHFGACIEGFMPQLAFYRHASGSTGVIGIRRAVDEQLFLEHYLDTPIDAVILRSSGIRVQRDRIAEVGQFVVDDREIVGSFFRDLVPFLRSEGFDWVCFTGTRRIRTLLASIGFAGFSIASASLERITDARDDWGTYYEHEPEVIVGKLSDPRGTWFRHSGNAD